MDLRNHVRVANPECFICRWAGRYIVVWPQEVLDTERWSVYINVHESIPLSNGGKMRSRHTVIYACQEHFAYLYQNWQDIIRQEVDLDYIWNQYIERIES